MKSENAENDLTDALEFNHDIFFYICLPPIIFASGYTMHRGTFFENLKMVMIFGVIGTLISFSTFALMTIGMNNAMEMGVYDGATGEWGTLVMESREIILMCSLLCSSDVIAAVSLLNFDKEPRLYSIVFGEGITNDAVSIILFNTVLKYTKKNAEITWSTPLTISGNFVLLGAVSVLIGAVFGFASSSFFKYFRSLTHNSTASCVVLFSFAYMSYVFSELCHESGIISLLVCGIVQGHYTYYNLSSMGQQGSYTVFNFISFTMEAFVFIYLGTSFFSFGDLRWCPMLIFVEIVVIMIGRFVAVLGLLLLLRCCCCFDSKLTF